MGKIFYGKVKAVDLNGGDADCIEVWVEEVGAVGRAGHPDLVE